MSKTVQSGYFVRPEMRKLGMFSIEKHLSEEELRAYIRVQVDRAYIFKNLSM